MAGFSGVNYFEQRPGCAPAIFRESENCEKSVFMYEENSLDFLERNKGKCTFDIIIVDGDHNYYTVLKELNLLMNYTTENTIICVMTIMGSMLRMICIILIEKSMIA